MEGFITKNNENFKVDELRRQIVGEEVTGVEKSLNGEFVAIQFKKGKTIFCLTFPIDGWDYSDYEELSDEELEEVFE